ncbi:helix-turn-helix domain-containing protein [Bacillus sp. FJAT-52991]|uniref:Helix-turn-helix domain-containing protein n=1 Tax=Bacillus kandeliae TaxID=3129297 RepID=A0ABZ2N398_9BACI
MYGLMIGLAAAAVVFFLLSLFQKDRYTQLSKEVEELSMQHLQESYQLKQKIKILEEELFLDGSLELNGEAYTEQTNISAIIKNQVIALYYQGTSINAIAKQSSLSTKQVQQILKPYMEQKE